MTLTTGKTLLLHNPRCSKSRAALALLEARGVDFETRAYLEEPLDLAELQELRDLLDLPARDWVRTKEAAYESLGLSPAADDAAHFQAFVAEPTLLERPILIHQGRAAIGRPTERLEELLEDAEG